MTDLNKHKLVLRSIAKAFDSLLKAKAHQAIAYQHPRLIVKVTRRGKPDKGSNHASHAEFVLTIGRPAFRERVFIKHCIKAGESFPVKRVQLRFVKP